MEYQFSDDVFDGFTEYDSPAHLPPMPSPTAPGLPGMAAAWMMKAHAMNVELFARQCDIDESNAHEWTLIQRPDDWRTGRIELRHVGEADA